ncbi:MAG: helix-turn-helix transcriptional regulator [Eubacteriales bacterium]|jgi:transcriptional regulator with XRE-family HTH domain
MSLSEVRKKKGIAAQNMAERVGITTAELIQIEQGKRKPRLCMAQIWANALNLSFEEFSWHYYEIADPAQIADYKEKE